MGYIYFIRFENDSVKVGMSRTARGLKSRISAHKSDASKFDIGTVRIYTTRVKSVLGTESKLIKASKNRASKRTRNEYFHGLSKSAEFDITRQFSMKLTEGMPTSVKSIGMYFFRRMVFSIPPAKPESLKFRLIADGFNVVLVLGVVLLAVLR